MMAALILVMLTGGCWLLCRWLSPKALRETAARLLARAEAVEARDLAYRDGLKHWRAKFALTEKRRFVAQVLADCEATSTEETA